MESHCGAETALAEGTEAPRNNAARCIMRRHVRRPLHLAEIHRWR